MPVKPTYPGVYIEEISSGVRTIDWNRNTGKRKKYTSFSTASHSGRFSAVWRHSR